MFFSSAIKKGVVEGVRKGIRKGLEEGVREALRSDTVTERMDAFAQRMYDMGRNDERLGAPPRDFAAWRKRNAGEATNPSTSA